MSELDTNFDNQLAAFMGGEKVEEVKEVETVETVPEEETIQEPVKPVELTNFDKAKGMGWNPNKEEYEAKTGRKWSNEDDYLKIRSLSDENHKLKQQQAKRDKEFDRRLRNVEQPIANIAQNEHKQRLDNVTQSLKQAAIDQDFDAIDALLAERDKLLKAEPVAKQEEPLAIDDIDDGGETQEQLQAAAQKWIAENPWYNKLTQAGRDQAAKLEAEYRAKVDCTTEEALAYVAQEMAKDPIVAVLKGKLKSPDVTPRTAERPRVASASESSLDPASRNIYNKMISQGLLKTAAEKSAFIKDALGA
jgi:hypothetical protein